MTEMERIVLLAGTFNLAPSAVRLAADSFRDRYTSYNKWRSALVGILRQLVTIEVLDDGFGRFSDRNVMTLNDKRRADVVFLVCRLSLERIEWQFGREILMGFEVTPEDLGTKHARKPAVKPDPLEGTPARGICLN